MIGRPSLNNIRYVDDIVLMAESESKLHYFHPTLHRVIEESNWKKAEMAIRIEKKRSELAIWRYKYQARAEIQISGDRFNIWWKIQHKDTNMH